MTDPTFRAKIRPELHPAAQELVAIYEATPGSTGPGCCPEALAAVLERMALSIDRAEHEEAGIASHLMKRYAALLRGEQP
jgi:hypothetical protein